MNSDGKPRTKGERLSLTCNACRSRHQKCNGTRPLCYSCQLRGLSCRYPGVPDDEQPAPRQKGVAGDQKPYTLSNKRSRQRTVSIDDSQEGHGAIQEVLVSELVLKPPRQPCHWYLFDFARRPIRASLQRRLKVWPRDSPTQPCHDQILANLQTIKPAIISFSKLLRSNSFTSWRNCGKRKS
jgi:hypothetical protein